MEYVDFLNVDPPIMIVLPFGLKPLDTMFNLLELDKLVKYLLQGVRGAARYCCRKADARQQPIPSLTAQHQVDHKGAK